MKKKEHAPCPHPPERLYSWHAHHLGEEVLVVACCDCGAVLKGASPEPKEMGL